MKKTIKGFRYDTEKSIKIGSYATPLPKSNMEYWTATLYKTKRSNQYFLAGFGMHMTRFATEKSLFSWGSGEVLIPLSFSAAYMWAESYLAPEVFVGEFMPDTKQMCTGKSENN